MADWFNLLMMRTTLFILLLLLSASACSDYRQGSELYRQHCAACHMDDGLGLKGVIPPLASADYLARDPAQVACIIQYGLRDSIIVNGVAYREPMAAVEGLSEIQIANIINYINHAWGNDYGYVSVQEIQARLTQCANQ